MRTDAIELGLMTKSETQREMERSTRAAAKRRRKSALEHVGPTVDAIDEAFAGLPNYSAIPHRRDMPQAGPMAGGAAQRRPLNLAVVKQLAAQLEALDRQREQLSRLLREIEVAPLVDD
jgi:hypothetical protein